LLLLVIIFFSFTSIDFIMEDYMYDFTKHSWYLDRDSQPYHFLLYSGIKKLLIVLALFFLIALVLSYKHESLKPYKSGIIIVLLSALLVPATVGALKKQPICPALNIQSTTVVNIHTHMFGSHTSRHLTL